MASMLPSPIAKLVIGLVLGLVIGVIVVVAIVDLEFGYGAGSRRPPTFAGALARAIAGALLRAA